MKYLVTILVYAVLWGTLSYLRIALSIREAFAVQDVSQEDSSLEKMIISNPKIV